MRYAIYCRKSSESEDRQILSLESQLNELNRLSSSTGLIIKKTYQESKSAKEPEHRPLFKELIEQIKTGEIDSIVCWDINRLSRNPVDSGLLQWLLQNERIKEIITPRKTYRKEDTGLLMSVELGSANQFILDLSKNVKRGLRTKAEKGWLPNGCKPGYMNDKYAEKGNKTILIDPTRFPIIEKAWEMLLSGKYSPPEIIRQINKLGYRSPSKGTLGGKPMARSQIYQVFHDPFYYGVFEFPLGSEQYYQGKHEPMITKEEFDKAQMILGGNKIMPNPKNFTYSNLFKCGECGCQITIESKQKYFKGTNRYIQYIYHHCTHRKTNYVCKQKSIEESMLEKQIREILETVTIPNSFTEFARNNLKYLYEKERKEEGNMHKTSREIQSSIAKQLDRLLELAINGAVSQEEYSEKKIRLQKEMLEVKDKNQKTCWYDKAASVLDACTLASSRFSEGNKEAKRNVLQSLCSNLTIKDKKATLHLEKPFVYIRSAISSMVNKYDKVLEPQENIDTAMLLNNINPNNPTWLPLVNAFKNREIEFGFSLQNIQTVLETFQIQPTINTPLW